MVTAFCHSMSAGSANLRSVKLTLPINQPIGGMMMSSTSEVTILPNAAPMITPTARSTTFHFIAKSRNSRSTLIYKIYKKINTKSIVFILNYNSNIYCFKILGLLLISRLSDSITIGALYADHPILELVGDTNVDLMFGRS